mmetsp:Transcript_56071/g.132079  ORF Transcript_56071/g.132079 Transcript_56071/m.132079 type:complete len:382 (-) Transcript_56071:160-1305(-)
MTRSSLLFSALVSVLPLSTVLSFSSPARLLALSSASISLHRPPRLPYTGTEAYFLRPIGQRTLCLRMGGGGSKTDGSGGGGKGSQVFKRNSLEGVLGYLNLWPGDGKIVLNDGGAAGSAPPTSDTAVLGWEVSEQLRKSITAMYGQYLSEDGTGVDYAAMRDSTEFEQYVQLSYKLNQVEVSGMGASARAAFFINIYNSLLIHAICALGPPADLLSRLRLYAVASYRIAGASFSLNDIENGILRSNRPAPGPLSKAPFSSADPRSKFIQPSCDPRVHFALNCGAKGCPPVRFYSPEGLDAELDKATRAFCAGIDLDAEKGEVLLSEIFKWYKDDFTTDGKTLLQYIGPYLSAEKQAALAAMEQKGAVKVGYQPYDWGLNSK